METATEKLSNGNTGRYKIINGTAYHADTEEKIVNILERSRANRSRLRLHWGDIKTGLDWGDTHDVTGHIGRSTGSVKIPLLIHNSRSLGGGGILDDCIVKIRYANKKEGGVLYQHPEYHTNKKGRSIL